MAREAQVGVLANNLANAATPGYRRDAVAFRSFPQLFLSAVGDPVPRPLGPLGTGCAVAAVAPVFRDGSYQETGNPYDLALQGAAFFAVRGPGGDVFYTRAGNFQVDATGRLVTPEGMAVLGEGEGQLVEIYVEGELRVGEDGSLSGARTQGGQPVARLALFSLRQARKVGTGLFTGTAEVAAPGTFAVRQGFREGANVNPVAEMVALLAAVRAYEASQKVVQATDQTLEKAVNQLGRV